ncbi:MAG: hypothetical protein MJ054_01040 [Clostridia bacterium]|nr:hypothetical protein [Clostridia bacterium]
MIKRTFQYLWGKKFVILLLALVLILLPNTIGHNMQVLETTVITEMNIQKVGNEIQITAQKFKPVAGADSISYETVTYSGTNIRDMLVDTSLAHCSNIQFNGEPDLGILHDLYHYKDLRGNTMVNGENTINNLLRKYDENEH